MLINATLQKLNELGLTGMATALEQQTQSIQLQQLTFDERLSMLIDSEESHRHNKRFSRLFKASRIRQRQASLEDIDYSREREIDHLYIRSLTDCQWIQKNQNLILTGATGTGKSYLASAFGVQACRLDLSVQFYTATELYETLSRASVDGTLLRVRNSLVKAKLLIIDDLGIGGIDSNMGPILLDIIDQQTMTGSILVTSQFPTDRWYDLFNDPTIADAILDRLLHKAHFIKLKGESMRRKNRVIPLG